MEELLAHPAFQAALAPFLAALAVAALLRQTRLPGLAVVAAFAVVIALTVGFSLEPLTAMRKLILVGLGTAVLVLLIELSGIKPTLAVRIVLAAVAAAAAVWVLWRVLLQLDAAKALLYGTGAATYLAVGLDGAVRVGGEGNRGAVTALVSGLVAGALSVLGASAILGQVGIAVAAGAGAVLLVQLLARNAAPPAWTVAVPATLISGVVGLLAVFTGSLPWFALVPVLGIPWATRLATEDRHSKWRAAALAALAACVPGAIAVTLAWFTAGAAS